MKYYQTREIVEDDVNAIIDLYSKYRLETYTAEKITNLILSFPSILSEMDGKLIGFCYTEYFAPDILAIGSIYVAKEFRNRGLGTQLIASIHSQATKVGYEATILSNSGLYPTYEQKLSARGFYTLAGYELVWETQNTVVLARSLP